MSLQTLKFVVVSDSFMMIATTPSEMRIWEGENIEFLGKKNSGGKKKKMIYVIYVHTLQLCASRVVIYVQLFVTTIMTTFIFSLLIGPKQSREENKERVRI